MADRAASGSDLPAAGSLPLDGDLAPECGQERIPSIDHGNDRSADQADDNRWQQADLLALIAPELSHADSLRLKPPRPSAQDREVSSRSQASRLEASAVRGVGPVCPQTLLLLDTETTGLSPDAATCIEVGAILFHVPTRAVLSQLSFLLPCASNPAEAINGIPAAVTRLSQPWKACLACFEAMLAAADAVLAHHAAFDRQWFGREPLPPVQLPWICSMEDIRWPPERQLRPTPSVRDLALAYGVPVWAAHRALTDCIYLAQVFERCEELEALLVAALEPRRLYRARLSYDERHRAREAGFRWNNPVPGAWSRRLSEHEAAALDFPVVPVESPPLPRSA